MAVALIYAQSGGGKTINSTLVEGGFLEVARGEIVEHKAKGKNILLSSDNSSVSLNSFDRPNLDIEPVWNWLEKDKDGNQQENFNAVFGKVASSGKYDTIIVDNVTSVFNNAILEMDESGRFKDMRQAYQLIYNGLRRLSIKAAQAQVNVVFTAWHDTEELVADDGKPYKRIQPKLPGKILDDFTGMCNIVAYINSAEKEGKRIWYYKLEGKMDLYAKDQIYNRKSCMPEDLFKKGNKTK
ncbi:MAG TPA: AAA family ATPase [Atopostipes sp.]|nr:AAA family ATPase [Atopostipes sp.]